MKLDSDLWNLWAKWYAFEMDVGTGEEGREDLKRRCVARQAVVQDVQGHAESKKVNGGAFRGCCTKHT